MEASVIHAPARNRPSATGRALLPLRSDDQLVALFRMGYDEAFGAIHDRYRRRLLAYTSQMLSRSNSDAEDVLQDTFLRAYSALRQDDRPVTLRAWLYRVAHNRCIDELRRPVPPMAEIFELQRRPAQDPPVEAERRMQIRRLVADMQRLPEQQRSALLMRELEGLAYAELADALGTSLPAVKSLLVRARCNLVEAGDARDAACLDIRADLDDAIGRGVRAGARARRHLRDCAPCREYRQAARRTRHGLQALSPGHGPLAALAKLLGLGGAGSAAGVTAAGGGSAAVIGTGAAATATKVVAAVCCAAVVGGGAAEVSVHSAAALSRPAHRSHLAPAAASRPDAVVAAPTRIAADPFRVRERAPAERPAPSPAPTQDAELAPIRSTAPGDPVGEPAPAAPAPSEQAAADQATAALTGGVLAPDEDPAADGSATATAPDPTAPAPATPAPAAPVTG